MSKPENTPKANTPAVETPKDVKLSKGANYGTTELNAIAMSEGEKKGEYVLSVRGMAAGDVNCLSQVTAKFGASQSEAAILALRAMFAKLGIEPIEGAARASNSLADALK